jgi:DNA-binding LacI/PurR family transcriptional regulator
VFIESSQRVAADRARRTVIRLRDIAAVAQVSMATASRTLNHSTQVSSATANRVWESMHKLGYRPNAHARSLKSRRSGLLGLVVDRIAGLFVAECIRDPQEAAFLHPYEILVTPLDHDERRAEACVRRMLEQEVEGVIVMSLDLDPSAFDKFLDRGVPVVFIDERPEGTRAAVLEVDYGRGIRQAIQHLAALGHRHIGYIAEAKSSRASDVRTAAVEKASRECGLELLERWSVDVQGAFSAGERAAKDFLARKRKPTAVVCSNGLAVAGVLHGAAKSDLRLPRDLSVVGLNDLRIAEFTTPALTSLQVFTQAMAKAAVVMVHNAIENATFGPVASIATQLVVRESTTVPRRL